MTSAASSGTLFVAMAFAVAGTSGLASPDVMRVTGVAENDTLNVREAPSADAADLGDLAHDQTGIEVLDTDPTGDWSRILWNEGDGWIASRFLAAADWPEVAGSGLPTGLMCAGVEPFWSLRLSETGAVYASDRAVLPDLTIDQAMPAAGSAGFPVWLSLSNQSVSGLVVVRDTECSDTMSDRRYGWQSDLALFSEAGGAVLTGCCSLPLEVGSQ